VHLRIDGVASYFELDPVPDQAYGYLFLPGEKPLPFHLFWHTFQLFPWETKAEAQRRIQREKCAVPEGTNASAIRNFEMAKAGALRRIEQSSAK
jgi:hypothetical protein